MFLLGSQELKSIFSRYIGVDVGINSPFRALANVMVKVFKTFSLRYFWDMNS